MSAPIRWMKQQLAKAERDAEEVQNRVATWKEAIRLAEEAEGSDQDLASVIEGARQEITKSRRSGKIIKSVKEILEERGPCKAVEIQAALEEIGIRTTTNSINTSLNRFRPDRFNRNEEGKWFLVKIPKVDQSPHNQFSILEEEGG